MTVAKCSHIHKLSLKRCYIPFPFGQPLSGSPIRHTPTASANKFPLGPEAPSRYKIICPLAGPELFYLSYAEI